MCVPDARFPTAYSHDAPEPSSGLGDGALDPPCDDRPNGHQIFTTIRRPAAASTCGSRPHAAGGHAPVCARAHRPRQGSAPGSTSVVSRTLRTDRRARRSGGAARAPGADAGARARADPLRPDAGLAVRVLPRRGDDHGERPRLYTALGLTVQCCGDAHLSNFGAFASPERRLVFDINDFDETLPGPWEWDVKRLAASMLIAAVDNGFGVKDQDKIVLETVGAYRGAVRDFAGMSNLGVWYSHLDFERPSRSTRGSSSPSWSPAPRRRLPRPARATACRRSTSSPRSSTARCRSSTSRR